MLGVRITKRNRHAGSESLACGIPTRASPLANALSYFLKSLLIGKFTRTSL
jgi:hypothetical protein